MTAQVYEKIIFEGEKTSIAFCPPLPDNDPRIIELDVFCQSSACWRGYTGTWEIKDNKFYLVNLDGRFKLQGNKPIFANWFNGTLRIPQGNMLHYFDLEVESIFESEFHIKIENGEVIDSKVIDNRTINVDEILKRRFREIMLELK